MARTVTVGPDSPLGPTNAAIQRAVDELAAAGGGTVLVAPGAYRMTDSLHLRSGVRVIGQAGAILKKVPSVSSPLADYIGYGHYEFTVTEPEKFRVGMGVSVLDDRSGGFYDTVATITGQDGDLFYIDRMLNHDYQPTSNGRVVSVFSLVEGIGVRDAAVEGLALDGNRPAEAFKLNGCRGGGVFLLQSQRVAVRNIEVVDFNGDGVSFQQCADVAVEDCRLHHNAGHGLHPGSGSVRYVMRRVESHDNGACGVYYCLRTTHSILEGCNLRDNGLAGISIGERDSDHLIRNNQIAGNGSSGIAFRRPRRRGGDRVVIQANAIGPNCAKDEKARFEVAIPAGLKDVILDGNAINPGPAGGELLKAVQVEPGCAGIYFVNNIVGGAKQARKHIDSADGEVSFVPPPTDKFPPVGPAALPLNGARHLNFADLAPWAEVG